jgi:hypothetical protein
MSEHPESVSGRGGRRYDAALHLLDHQLVDRHGELVGKIDDLELTRRPDGHLAVTGLLTGGGALGPRLPGVLGRSWVAIWRRLHPDRDPQPARIAADLISDIGSSITLAADHSRLPGQSFERWAAVHVVGKLPGAGHAGE